MTSSRALCNMYVISNTKFTGCPGGLGRKTPIMNHNVTGSESNWGPLLQVISHLFLPSFPLFTVDSLIKA